MYIRKVFVSMTNDFLPSLLNEMPVYFCSLFSFPILNKNSIISLIPKEISSGMQAFQCRTDTEYDKITASPDWGLINEKSHFKQGMVLFSHSSTLTRGCCNN